MKKIACMFIFSVLMMTSCTIGSNNNIGVGDIDSSENGENTSSGEQSKSFDIDFSKCIANIQNASSLRISKKRSMDLRVRHLDNASTSYLYKSEDDINDAIEVTFTRFTTTTVSTPVNGEIAYSANKRDDDGFISIHAEDTFSYSLYDSENQLILSDISDNCEHDNDERTGIIEIVGLTPYAEYLVKYSGYRETQEISQEELGAEIDKLFVFSPQFTFVSFVPSGESNRPSDQNLVFDKDGISTYDKTDYTDNEFRKSFVFDNYSGLIYSLENTSITRVGDGLVFSNGEYCDISTKEDGSLVISPICKNKTITVSYAFKDKYNNKYILNNKLETYDAKTNSYYYVTSGNTFENINAAVNFPDRYIYVKTSTNEAIRFPSAFAYGGDMENRKAPKTIDLMLENGNIRQLNESDSFELLSPNVGKNEWYIPQRVVNGFVYVETSQSTGNCFKELFGSAGMWYLKNNGDDLKVYHIAAHAMPAVNLYYLNFFDVMFVLSGDGKIYSIQNCLDYLLHEENPTIPGSTQIWVGNPYLDLAVDGVYVKELLSGVILENGKIIQYGVDGNIYYDVFVEGSEKDPIISVHETGTYIPEEPETTAITIQPINR